MSYEPITDEDIGSTRDLLGRRVDRNIRRPVVAVNRYVPTTGSCEGHACEGGSSYPYIDVDESRGNVRSLVRKIGEHNRQNPQNRVAIMMRNKRQQFTRIVPAEMAPDIANPEIGPALKDPETGETYYQVKSPKVSRRKLGAFRSSFHRLASRLQCQNCGNEAEHRHGQHGCCGEMMCHSLIGVRHDIFGETNESYGFDWSGLQMDGGILW